MQQISMAVLQFCLTSAVAAGNSIPILQYYTCLQSIHCSLEREKSTSKELLIAQLYVELKSRTDNNKYFRIMQLYVH
ncbi:hypothetical protein O6P43_021129 [Quillaja saponaria]|uniref:Secreted protein n=1 Tax=Quillaja saponaria TaxID=32244 RepID=A0AAD7LMF8_QUISA|nr:hypothetical protein O6P43_021129 [Quillaja saponaria]